MTADQTDEIEDESREDDKRLNLQSPLSTRKKSE